MTDSWEEAGQRRGVNSVLIRAEDEAGRFANRVSSHFIRRQSVVTFWKRSVYQSPTLALARVSYLNLPDIAFNNRF